MSKQGQRWMRWGKPDSPARLAGSLLRLSSLVLLLTLVVAKVQGIVPTAVPAFWAVLGAVFLLITAGATWISARLSRVAGLGEDASEWVAVVLLSALVALLAFLNRGVFWYFLQ